MDTAQGTALMGAVILAIGPCPRWTSAYRPGIETGDCRLARLLPSTTRMAGTPPATTRTVTGIGTGRPDLVAVGLLVQMSTRIFPHTIVRHREGMIAVTLLGMIGRIDVALLVTTGTDGGALTMMTGLAQAGLEVAVGHQFAIESIIAIEIAMSIADNL